VLPLHGLHFGLRISVNVFPPKKDGFIYSLSLRIEVCLFNDTDNCYVAFMVDELNTNI
jgi:hypothetical protein